MLKFEQLEHRLCLAITVTASAPYLYISDSDAFGENIAIVPYSVGGVQQFDVTNHGNIIQGGLIAADYSSITIELGSGSDTVNLVGVTEANGFSVTNTDTNLGEGGDTFYGTPSSDAVWGEAGTDTIQTYAGNDYLYGGDFDDNWLYGGSGEDFIEGGDATDTINGGDDADYIDGGIDSDLIEGGNGNDYIVGGPYNNANGDWISGDAGDDSIYGGGGNDELYGADGNDYIRGADGVDVISGGGGMTLCIPTKLAGMSRKPSLDIMATILFQVAVHTL